MTIKNFAITGLASAAIMAATATPALACSHPVQKPAVHQNENVVVQKKDCDHKVVVTPKPTPTPAPTSTKKDCDHKTVTVTTPGKGDAKGQTLSSTTTQPAAQTVAKTTTQPMPTELPKTGSTAGLSTLLGLPTLALAGRAYLRSRIAR